VLNAVAAIEQDGLIRLTAATEGAWAVLRVSDTGAGMSEDVRLHCFEPFFSTKGAHGSGLGLAMCHGIAQRHGGQITVDSQLGRGAVFTIRLPHHAAATVDYAEAEVSPPSAAENPPTTLHLRVLAIDDEVLSLTLVSRYLTAKGHAVETASSGAEALTKLRAHCYDAVVTDRAMAGIGGDEIARIIQQITPSTPVLMLTGFGDLMNFKSERPRGVDAVIGKPVTPDELNLAVEQLVRRRRGDKCVGG